MVSLSLAVDLYPKAKMCDYMVPRAVVLTRDFLLVLYHLQGQEL